MSHKMTLSSVGSQGPMILPYIIVVDLNIFIIKKWCRPGVFGPVRALALVPYAVDP